jgi:glycerol-3-phosphate dehydrogenase
LSVFSGKITTYRRLAEEAVSMLQQELQVGDRATDTTRPWTSSAPLPGGDMPRADYESFLRSIEQEKPWLPAALRQRYTRAYGTRVLRLLGAAQSLEELGAEVLPGLFEREIRYLVRVEFARSADDILWRRSKLGLHLGPQASPLLEAWLAQQVDPTASGC